MFQGGDWKVVGRRVDCRRINWRRVNADRSARLYLFNDREGFETF